MTVAVLVVAGATLVRAGISLILADAPDLLLVGAAASLHAAGPMLASAPGDPDARVVVIDSDLPDGDSTGYGTRLRQTDPRLGVVLLGNGDDLLFRALESGISAFVPHTAPVEDLLAGIRHAAVTPGSFTTPDLVAALAREQRRRVALSPREVEVLGLSRDGLTTHRISSRLNVTESTVKTYLSRIYDKLGVRTRADALAVAVQRGLL